MRWLLILSLVGCSQSLPHRQPWELYSIQGLYSQPSCPNQTPYYLTVDGTEFFLMCLPAR